MGSGGQQCGTDVSEEDKSSDGCLAVVGELLGNFTHKMGGEDAERGGEFGSGTNDCIKNLLKTNISTSSGEKVWFCTFCDVASSRVMFSSN